ncbi:double zinc ribbon domain-containing protein, partial [Burkholderia stagnalis]|uniref:double zinc ribbon domain-containing protein n=1 Tax=Burkholderia stagnalis TaxID=1503054 RepID=UPI0012D85C08
MRCAHCGFDNPAAARFCETCGSPMSRICPRCGHASGPSAKFCSECGAPLADAPSGTPPPPSPKPATELSPAPIHYTPH